MLHLLILADSAAKAEGLECELRRGGLNPVCRTAQNEAEFSAGLGQEIDVILIDCSHPHLDWRRALTLAGERQLNIPIIALCDSGAEESGVAALAAGAADYLVKDRLLRLGWAVRRAAEARKRRADRDAVQEALGSGEGRDKGLLVLRQSEEQYRNMVEGALEGLAIHQDGIIQFANRSAARLAGYDRAEDLVGRNIWDMFVAPEARAELQARCAACLRGEAQPMHQGWPGIRKDGSRVWVQSSVAQITWKGRSAFLGFFSDITERKRAEELLRASEERFSKAFHGSPLPVSIVSLEEGRYIDANASLLQMVGWTREELIGRTTVELGLWPDLAQRAALARQVGEHSESRSFEARLRVKSGELRDVLIWAELIHLGGERCMIVVTQDITEQKRAEESLRESEERFRQLADNINKVFWITDPDNTRMIYVSPAYERIWGRTCASLYACPGSWFDAVHPDDQRVCQEPEFRQGVRDSVYRITRGDGAVRWIRDRAFPVRDASGAIHRVAGIAEDITEQRVLEDQLRQAQKMEAIGQLAGGIAHDFNNLLTVIQGHAALLTGDSITQSEIEDAAEQISSATQRAASLTRQLLMFGRRQLMQPRDVDINDVIERTGKMLRRILGEDVELIFHRASALPLVHADPGMIEQVLLNLAVNSRDAMPEGGRLTITTAPTVLGEEPAHPRPDITGRAGVCITVTDTGCGIAPENLSRVFEPFFTTKGVGKGTGLGLASAYGIIKQHQGWIRVSSELNRGTTFQIGLPASRRTAPVKRAAECEAPIDGGTEGILLVEDEPSLRLLVRNLLQRYGYRVFEAASGKDALAVWQQQQEAIDLVLTDMVMPDGMSGRQLADELQRRRPALKIIFSSGYSAEVVGKGLVLEDGINFLQKPYDPQLLATIVRSCLDAK